MIVVSEVGIQLVVAVLTVGSGVEVNAFPLDRAPEALDEGVVGGPIAPFAADTSASDQQGLFVGQARKLAALVGVEDERGQMLGQGSVQGREAEAHVERI